MSELPENWADLREAARKAGSRAWAPYSGFRVGAAVADDAGAIHIGCNVENGSFGLTSCAERNALAAAVAAGATGLDTLAIYTDGEEPWPPCGACRQVMAELMSPDGMVISVCVSQSVKRWRVADLMPDAFSWRTR